MCRGTVHPSGMPSTPIPAPAPVVRRVAIVSGSFGAGHDAAAREIGIRLAEHGIESDIHDIVDMFPPGLGGALKAAYLRQLRSAPTTWGWLLKSLDSAGDRAHSTLLARLATAVAGAAGRRVAERTVRGADAVIATHPFASQALGQLRRRGRLTQPVFTYLTDLSVHRLWVNNFVTAHLALHAVAEADARAHGAHSVQLVRPAVRRTPLGARPESLPDRDALRRELGLPVEARLALITGGAEGVGRLADAARDVLAVGGCHPVVLCGRNEHLRQHVLRLPGVSALGWVDDMPALYAAVDVVIQNAGGSTSLEALDAGLPVISYLCIPGHGETNANALHRAGLAPWVRSRSDLGAALGGIVTGPTATTTSAVTQLGALACVGAVVSALVEAG